MAAVGGAEAVGGEGGWAGHVCVAAVGGAEAVGGEGGRLIGCGVDGLFCDCREACVPEVPAEAVCATGLHCPFPCSVFVVPLCVPRLWCVDSSSCVHLAPKVVQVSAPAALCDECGRAFARVGVEHAVVGVPLNPPVDDACGDRPDLVCVQGTLQISTGVE